MPDTVPGAGVDLAYATYGAGRAVVLVHDLAADGPALEPLAQQLAGAARVIAYSRRGYGASTAPEPYAGTTVMEQGEDLAALLRGLDAAPAIGVGVGFGALAVLDVALRHPGLLAAAVLRDPPLLAFVPDAARELSEQRGRIEAAVFADGPRAGVAVWLAERGGRAAGAGALDAHRAFFADYAGLASWPVTRGELRRLALPLVVVTDPGTPAHLRSAADALAALAPGSVRADDGDLAAATRSVLVD